MAGGRRHAGPPRALPRYALPCLLGLGLLVLYVNRGFFSHVDPPTAGSKVNSLRFVESMNQEPNVLSRIDVDHCNAALKANSLESFETTLKTPTAEDPAKVSWYYRLRNLEVMRSSGYTNEAVLIMLVYNDKESWGPGRNFNDFMGLLEAFDYPTSKISLGILTSSMDEYVLLKTMMQQIVVRNKYAQVTVLFRDDFKLHVSRDDRHNDDVQKERRRMLARYRNYALSQCLEAWHSHVVWIDADIVKIPPYLVTKMVNAKLDILQPLCYVDGTSADYDLNAWKGDRKVPTEQERAAMRAGGLFVADAMPGTLHMKDMRWHEYHPLDSVGGTMLYVKADIHRQGVLFATHYIIGSEWKYEGYDGIETEGLCYVAGMLGYKCYAMPQDIIYHHRKD